MDLRHEWGFFFGGDPRIPGHACINIKKEEKYDTRMY